MKKSKAIVILIVILGALADLLIMHPSFFLRRESGKR